MSKMSVTDLEQLTQRLRDMKVRAAEEIRDAKEDMSASRAQIDNEVQDTADTAENKRIEEVRLAEIEIDRATLADIEQAEARMAAGRYGLCVACDTAIPRERLFAQPTALRCINCQSAVERKGAAG